RIYRPFEKGGDRDEGSAKSTDCRAVRSPSSGRVPHRCGNPARRGGGPPCLCGQFFQDRSLHDIDVRDDEAGDGSTGGENRIYGTCRDRKLRTDFYGKHDLSGKLTEVKSR